MSAPRKARREFERNVFINCPFDEEYKSILRPLLFTVIYLGFNPRLASESLDSHENRIDKICDLIDSSKYSIHDLSRIRAERVGDFSRMNMPFEMGIEYGCRRFGLGILRQKKCLILEKRRYDFMRALSDLSGVDIESHENKPDEAVRKVRNWLAEVTGIGSIASPTLIWDKFNDFSLDFYFRRRHEGFSEKDINTINISEYIGSIHEWIS